MSVVETATLLDEPHHDGSDLYVGDDGTVRAHVPQDVDSVTVRYVEDGEGRGVAATHEGDGWWSARIPLTNPVMNYRFLLSGGEVGYAWLNGLGLVDHEVPDADDFVAHDGSGRARRGISARSCTRSFPTASPRPATAGDTARMGRAPCLARAAERHARPRRRTSGSAATFQASRRTSTTSRRSARTSST